LALDDRHIQEQFISWERQRDILRETVNSLYDDGVKFKEWWNSQSSESQMALILASLEDLHKEFGTSENPGEIDRDHQSDDVVNRELPYFILNRSNQASSDPTTPLENLMEVICPELVHFEQLLENRGFSLLQMVEGLVTTTENRIFQSTIESFEKVMLLYDTENDLVGENESETSRHQQNSLKNARNKPLRVARSCILLQFTLNVMLIFEATTEASVEEA